jgi:hypothetical protein
VNGGAQPAYQSSAWLRCMSYLALTCPGRGSVLAYDNRNRGEGESSDEAVEKTGVWAKWEGALDD